MWLGLLFIKDLIAEVYCLIKREKRYKEIKGGEYKPTPSARRYESMEEILEFSTSVRLLVL